jgi:hypothetical protein
MTLLGVLLLGILAGLHAASWGGYKDSPFEGFHLRSFLRSQVVAVLASALLALWQGFGTGVIASLGAVYALERLATEWWKAIVRNDDQSAYTIPMRLAVGGRPVQHTVVRYCVGGSVVLALVAAAAALETVESTLGQAQPAVLAITVGSAGGWATAVGGAWKDAPIEGFSAFKFVRSPLVATAWAIPLTFLTSQPVLLLLASGGFAVASIETYKTFFTRGRPPGKFAGRPVLYRLPTIRRRLGRLHAALWAALGVGLLTSLPNDAPFADAAALFPNVLIAMVAGCTGFLAILVLDRNTQLARLEDGRETLTLDGRRR